jgi:ABC-type sugar transport system permease subunit
MCGLIEMKEHNRKEDRGGPPMPRDLRRSLWAVQARWAPYVFVLPFLAVFVCFMLYPLGRSFALSFVKTSGAGQFYPVGWDNYRFLLKDKLFWLACGNTALFAMLFLPIELVVSLGLALVLNSRRVRFRNFFRFAFFSTYLIGQVFLALLAHLMLAPRHGLVNQLIGMAFPDFDTAIQWNGKPNLAMPIVVLASVWVSAGYAMIYWLAALQAVDRELYDAADVDGAGRWARFWHVTLPCIRPIFVFLLLVGTIASLQLFELPWVFFQGPGPGYRALTIVEYLYANGVLAGDLGFASAVGWILLMLILGVTLLQIRLMRAKKNSS